MNITDPRFKYTPALHTNLRESFAKLNEPDERKPDVEGALRCMKKLQQSATVTNITASRRKK